MPNKVVIYLIQALVRGDDVIIALEFLSNTYVL